MFAKRSTTADKGMVTRESWDLSVDVTCLFPAGTPPPRRAMTLAHTKAGPPITPPIIEPVVLLLRKLWFTVELGRLDVRSLQHRLGAGGGGVEIGYDSVELVAADREAR